MANIIEHRIPYPDSHPFILTFGPDGGSGFATTGLVRSAVWMSRDKGRWDLHRERPMPRPHGELDREIDRLITNIAKGADFDTYNPKVNELAAERKRVKTELAQIAVCFRDRHRAPGGD